MQKIGYARVCGYIFMLSRTKVKKSTASYKANESYVLSLPGQTARIFAMQLSTKVSFALPERPISLHDRVVFIGSCFADKIGRLMKQSGLPTLVNPFGVLYNPLSILQAITQNPMADSLYFQDASGVWRCWLTDSSFNASSIDSCRAAVLAARGRLFEWNPNVVVITLGTNRYYQMKSMVVGNCHKQPAAMFTENALDVDQTVTILNSICQLFPKAQVIFTVSPYRYAKYGFHQNHLAKSVLLLAVDAVQKARPEQVLYFPAYELLLDELRDYRFYDDDMLHPSTQAVQYIWESFVQTFMDDESHRYFVDFEPIRRALMHRPFNADSEATERFLTKTHRQLADLQMKYNLGDWTS